MNGLLPHGPLGRLFFAMRASGTLVMTAGLLAGVLGARPAAAAGCTIANVTPIDFGVYDVSAATPLDATGELGITCDGETPVRISLGRGLAGRQSPRELRYRASSLSYDIFLDAAHSTVWGDGTGGTRLFLGLVPSGRALRIPMFARLYPRQAVPAGTYTDRIVVSVVF